MTAWLVIPALILIVGALVVTAAVRWFRYSRLVNWLRGRWQARKLRARREHDRGQHRRKRGDPFDNGGSRIIRHTSTALEPLPPGWELRNVLPPNARAGVWQPRDLPATVAAPVRAAERPPAAGSVPSRGGELPDWVRELAYGCHPDDAAVICQRQLHEWVWQLDLAWVRADRGMAAA